MALEIRGLPGGSVQGTRDGGQIENRPEQSTSTVATAQQSSGGDRFSLTSSASKMRALEERIASLPVVDGQRVEATRLALATGSHQIDPDTTADNVLAVERGFAQQE